MLYGYKETIDNRISTIVSAADTVEEYEDWIGKISIQDPHPNFEEYSASTFMDHLTRDEFSGYKSPVLILYHNDEEQRNSFCSEWTIKQIQSSPARDRQKDMLWKKTQSDKLEKEYLEEQQAEAEGKTVTGRSIEEIYGLIDNDPWDKRTPEQIAEDNEQKQRMKDLQKKGEMSGDSFGGADEQRAARAAERGEKPKKSDQGITRVTDIRTKIAEDGTVEIDNALARKWGGPTDEKLNKEREDEYQAKADASKKGKRTFNPEDFAEALRGDGSADHLDVEADDDAIKNRREPGRAPVFSEEAETARREFQAEQAIIAAENARKQREEQDTRAREDHKEGVFRGSDLWPDQEILVSELPESILKIFAENKITSEKLPLKDYPYNSSIGNRSLLPGGGRFASSMRVILTDNIEIDGIISIDNHYVMVVTHKDSSIAGWVIYAKDKKAKVASDPTVTPAEPESLIPDLYVVRIRPMV